MASVTPVVTDAATLEEVMDVLEEHVSIQMEGDFQPETLFEILVHAASNAESVEQTYVRRWRIPPPATMCAIT